MLKALRNRKTAKRIFIFLAIIIVPAFVLWGSGSLLRDKMRSSYAGEIFGQKVSFQTFRDALKAVENQAVIQFGDKFNQIRPLLDMETLAWERLIVLHRARQEKIKVSDEEVVKTIASYPFFQKNVKFNNEIYEQVLRYGLEITPKDFEGHIRESLEIAELFKNHTKDIKISEEEILNEFKKENEKVRVSFVAFPAEDFKNEISASEDDLKDYFDKHKTEFLTNPSINIEYIGSDIAAKATNEEKQKAKTQILSISETAKNEKDWKSFCQNHNLRCKVTGYFYINEPIPGIGWSTQFYEAILRLSPNEVSEPIETEQGVFLARLLGIRQPYIPEFNQIKEKVADKLKADKVRKLAFAKAQDIKKVFEDKLSTNPRLSFEKIAQDLNLEAKETDFFKQNQYLEKIGVSPEFSQAAFSLVNNPKKLAVISTPQASYIIKLLQFVPIDAKKFEAEKEKTAQVLKERKNEQLLLDFLQKLKLQAKLKSNIAQNKANAYQ